MNLNLQNETSFPLNTYFSNGPKEAWTPAQLVASYLLLSPEQLHGNHFL